MNERNDGEIIFNILDKIICGYANILKWHRQGDCKGNPQHIEWRTDDTSN